MLAARMATDLPTPTAETLAEYQEMLTLVIAQLQRIKRMSARYPVYIIVAGQPYRLDSPAHVDDFVGVLRSRTESYGG